MDFAYILKVLNLSKIISNFFISWLGKVGVVAKIGDKRIEVQCKHYNSKVGNDGVNDFNLDKFMDEKTQTAFTKLIRLINCRPL